MFRQALIYPVLFKVQVLHLYQNLNSSGYTHKSRTNVQNTGANLGLSSPFSQNRHIRKKKNLKKALPYDSRMCFICALGSKARNLPQALPPPEHTPRLGDVQPPVPRGNPFIQAPCSSRATKTSCSGPCPEYLQNLRLRFLWATCVSEWKHFSQTQKSLEKMLRSHLQPLLFSFLLWLCCLPNLSQHNPGAGHILGLWWGNAAAPCQVNKFTIFLWNLIFSLNSEGKTSTETSPL